MPPGSRHPCNAPACAELVPYGTPRCPKHTAQREREDRERRGSARERGYTSRWERYRAAYLKRHPLCVECAEGVPFSNGTPVTRVTPAVVVDHIVDHKGDHRLFWNPENHRPVCRRHHDQRLDAGDFGRTAR